MRAARTAARDRTRRRRSKVLRSSSSRSYLRSHSWELLILLFSDLLVGQCEGQHRGFAVGFATPPRKCPPADAQESDHRQNGGKSVDDGDHCTPPSITARAAASRLATPRPCRYATMASSSVLPLRASGAASICSSV